MNRHYLFGLLMGTLLSQPAYGTDTIIPFIGADAVHAQGIYGQGVTVVVIDSGIHSSHPGLQGSIAGGGITFQPGGPGSPNLGVRLLLGRWWSAWSCWQ